MTMDAAVTKDIAGFDRALIIGCGLIGGSVGHSLITHRACTRVTGYDSNESHARLAHDRGLIDEVGINLESAAAAADLIILAVPVALTAELIEGLAAWAQPHAVIVDSGSVKQEFLIQCDQFLPDVLRRRVVPCHPIAGHVTAGPQYADAALMAGRPMIMTPTKDTDPVVLERVENLWRKLDFETFMMSAKEHDAMYADLSHMPHVIAFTLMHHIQACGLKSSSLKKFAGNAFKDMTYHAGQNPRMWRDIFHTNRSEICRSLAGFRRSLDELESIIDSDDQGRLEDMLTELQHTRLSAW